jgi:hypothetical protein
MANDPISGIEGGVVGLGVATSLLGKAPVVGPEIAKGLGMLKGARDFNDQSYGRTVGAEQGNPLRESSIDVGSSEVGGAGAAAGGAEAAGAGLGDLAALAAL